MNAVQAKRLLNVARALRESPNPKSFTMGKYVHDDSVVWSVAINGKAVPKVVSEFACGTPACALGHYAARPDLQKLLRIEKERWASLGADLVFVKDGRLASFYSGWLHEYFGVDADEALLLFGPRGCDQAKTAEAAAKFIEKFVADKRRSRSKLRS